MVFQESQSSNLWFQFLWGPRTCAQPEVTILQLGGGLVPVEELRSVSDGSVHISSLRRNLATGPCLTAVT